MTTMKQMILGSAAALLAASTAQAADLPVKAKAVEYVKICSIYGAGFYYIPGTDTCIKIGGAIRLDTTFNGGPYDAPFWQGGAGGNNLWTKDNFLTRERINITTDTRTASEYGVVRTYANMQLDFTQNRDSIAIQLKLDELIRATRGAHNALLDIEQLSEPELCALRDRYEALAAHARARLLRGASDGNTPELEALAPPSPA
jgi:opacity protein-like surface antigen